MKKFLAFAFCLCAMFTLGLTLTEDVQQEPEALVKLAKDSKPDVRVGSEDEGIHFLSVFVSR